MADPSSYRPAPGSIPREPGVYRFYDDDDRVLYVGKAKNLRSRLSSYFADLSGLHSRTRSMVTTACRVDWVVVRNEVEALQLEYSWIKSYQPRFNVKYTDDKSYPYLAVTVSEEYPRITVMRGEKRRGVRYFGPYSHAWAIRKTVEQLLRVFPARTCSQGVFRRAETSGRPCLLGDIGRCSAPCVGRVSAEEHRQIVDDFCAFVAGNATRYLRRLDAEMREAAARQDFETAARLRDDLRALEQALEQNAVVFDDRTDADLIGLAEDELQASVQVFHVREGRVTGQRGFIVERADPISPGEMIQQVLLRLYGDDDGGPPPREVLVSTEPDSAAELAELLSELRGGRVQIRRPARGDKRALMDTVLRNADQSLALHRRRQIGDLTVRARALEGLQEALDLPAAPLRIEAYDISTLQGQDTVGSMVVFEDGLPKKSDYRRFTVSSERASSDLAAMGEVISRRFARYLRESGPAGRSGGADDRLIERGADVPGADVTDTDAPEAAVDARTGRRSFAYPPQLVLVDGGPAQAAAAAAALTELGLSDLPVCGLAKRLEEIWVPGEDDPIILSRSSPVLRLLQQLRDEAHRFAIAGHRRRRTARQRTSELDGVPGLGPMRRKALLARFRSVRAIRAAGVEELAEVPGIGPGLAEVIHTHLTARRTPGSPVINLTTGEVIGADE